MLWMSGTMIPRAEALAILIAASAGVTSEAAPPPDVELRVVAGAAAEGARAAPAALLLAAPVEVDITATIEVIGGSAGAGDLAGSLTWPVTIPAGAMAAPLTVPVHDDDVVELDETALIAITAIDDPSQRVAPEPVMLSLLGAAATPGFARSVCVAEGLAYATCGTAGLRIYDVTGAAPIPIGFHDTPGFARDVVVDGTTAYVVESGVRALRVIDVADPSRPVHIGALALDGLPFAIDLVGDVAYVAAASGGMHVVDVGDPAAPALVSSFPTLDFAFDVQVVGTLAYLAIDFGGLEIVDVSDPAEPVLVGHLPMAGFANEVHVVGDLAYVADGEGGLRIADVSDPADPTAVGGYDTSAYAERVLVVGGTAYVADNAGGIVLVDVSDPATPVFRAALATSGAARGIAIVGATLHVAASTVIELVRIVAAATATIVNDDEAILAVPDAYVQEGDRGAAPAPFDLRLSKPVDAPVAFRVTARDGTARAIDGDYAPMSRIVTIPAGKRAIRVSADVLGDAAVEGNERFFVELTGLDAVGRAVTVVRARGEAIIVDDDAAKP
jgi:hypothetical protein